MCSKIGEFERYRVISRELLNAQTPLHTLHCRRVWRTAVNFVGSCSTAFPEVLVEIYKYILDASLLINSLGPAFRHRYQFIALCVYMPASC